MFSAALADLVARVAQHTVVDGGLSAAGGFGDGTIDGDCGVAIAPIWQHGDLYGRLNAGYVHLLDRGVPSADYGNSGDSSSQITSTAEAGLVF